MSQLFRNRDIFNQSVVTISSSFVQNHRLLRPRAWALHCLERPPYAGYCVARPWFPPDQIHVYVKKVESIL